MMRNYNIPMATTLSKGIIVLSAIASLLFSCSKDETLQEDPHPLSKTHFDLEVESLGEDDADDALDPFGDFKALTYDEQNMISGVAHRLSVDQKLKTHTFFFSNSGRTMVGYAELEWTLTEGVGGKIQVACKGDYPVYEATYGSSIGYTTSVNKSKTIKLRKGISYKIIGIVDAGLLELGATDGTTFPGMIGPRVSFETSKYSQIFKEGYLKDLQGAIPYAFVHSIALEKEDVVIYKGVQFLPQTPVLRLEINNMSNKTLGPQDIQLEMEGLTSNFNLGFYRNYNTPALYIWSPYGPQNAMTKNSVSIPIGSLPPNAKGTYFLPVTLSYGDPNTIPNVKIDATSSVVNVNEAGKGYPFRYKLNGVSHVQRVWLNTGKKLRLIKLDVRD